MITFPDGLPGFRELWRFVVVEQHELRPIALPASLLDKPVRLSEIPTSSLGGKQVLPAESAYPVDYALGSA